MDENTNMTIDKRLRRKRLTKTLGLCPYCPLQGGENARRRPRYGSQKPRYKDKRS